MSGPLNISIPTDQAKTSIPMFVEKTYIKVRFGKVQQDTIEGKGDTIKFEFDLVDPAPNQDGGTILPGQLGSKVFKTVYLYGKDGVEAAQKRAGTDVGKILDGFLGTADVDNKKGKPARPAFGPELVPSLIGQISFLQMRNPTGDRTQQDISSFTFPGDVAGA